MQSHVVTGRRFSVCGAIACAALALSFSLSAAAQDYVERYGLVAASPSIDLGVQPLGYPSGVLSSVMQRDRTLRAALQAQDKKIQSYAFRRGADMVPLLADGRLEAGLIGDMPTILSAATGAVWVVGLVKQAATAIVARGNTQINGLVGKRIGYVDTSSAHHTLLQGLAAAGINETQVSLVPLAIDAMPDALAKGEIDAFAAWEPAPAIAMAQSKENHIVFRGQSTDYFVLERKFVAQQPEAALQVVASYLRAIEWLRRSQRNVEKAAAWVLQDGQVFSGKSSPLMVAQVVAIAQREILTVPSAPVILKSGKLVPLSNEFAFLGRLKKLPPNANAERLAEAFTYPGLSIVMGDAKRFQLAKFDYDTQ